MRAQGEGGLGGPVTSTAAAAAQRLPAAAPSPQTLQVHTRALCVCACVCTCVCLCMCARAPMCVRLHVSSPVHLYKLGVVHAWAESALTLRGGDQNLLPAMTRSLSVPDSSPLWDIYTSASPQSGVCPLPAPSPASLPQPEHPCSCPSLLQVVRPVFGTYQLTLRLRVQFLNNSRCNTK